MSRTSAPVLTSLLLLLLLLLPRDSAAAAASKQLESKSCKTLDEVLLEKYVTRPKRSSSDDDVNATTTTTPLPSGSSDSNWRGLYLLLQDRAEQLCDKTLYLQLEKRFSNELANSHWQDNGATTSAVPQTESEDQQANNVTPSSTAQKESTRINASTTITYNDDEPSGKFHEKDSALTGHLNQTFDNEVSGNETSTPPRDNEDESEANEAIHARSKEDFLASVRRDKRPRFDQDDDEIVAKLSEAEEEIIDGVNGPYEADGNGTVDEDDRLVNEFFANEESMSFDDEKGNTTSSEFDKFVDDFFANESNASGDNETVSEEDKFVNDFFSNESADLSDNASNDNETSSGEDKLVDDFFANESADFSNRDNETVSEDDKLVNDFFANESAGLLGSNNKTVGEEDELVNDFFANEGENFSGNGSTSVVVKGHDEFVDGFFANENENGNQRNEASGHQKITLDNIKSNETASENYLVDDFFASENENLTGNGIEVEGPNRDSNGTTLDDKANNNKTASSEFNSIKSHGRVSPSNNKKLTPSPELFVATFSGEQHNATDSEKSMTNNSTMSLAEVAPTKSLEEFLTGKANSTPDFSNNSTEIPRDFHELISSREVAIANEKNTTAAQPYSNETATTANGTEDRSAKYPDTGNRDKAGHTPSGGDLFKETTTTTPSSDDWSSTIAPIGSPNEATEPPTVRRRRRDTLMTFQDDDTAAAASAGKLRASEATSSSRLVDYDDAWESSNSSSRNRPARIISVEMNKGGELRRQYRTFLLGLASPGQTQFAEKRDSRHRRRSRASTEVEQ